MVDVGSSSILYSEPCIQQQQSFSVTEEIPQTSEMEEVLQHKSTLQTPTSIKVPRKLRSKNHTLQAVTDFKVSMDTKLKIKENYYNNKLYLLERLVVAEDKKCRY